MGKKHDQITVTAEEMRAFVRCEISYDDLNKGDRDALVYNADGYRPDPEDVLAGLRNRANCYPDDKTFDRDWFRALDGDFYNFPGLMPVWDETQESLADSEGFPTDVSILTQVSLCMNRLDESFSGRDPDIEGAIHELEVYLDNRDKAASKRELTDSQKWSFIEYWRWKEEFREARPFIIRTWKRFVEDLCAGGSLWALEIKAYGCYGDGTFPYKQDWRASTDALLAMMDLQPDPQIANTLGYMYYYGRTTGGKPDYEKAFRCFSIGAAGGVTESRYKLADMFYHGYGVQKNVVTAYHLVDELYDKELDRLRWDDWDSDFADVDIRMGRFREERYGEQPDVVFEYYLQAKHALELRMKSRDYYGDKSVYERLLREIEEVLPRTSYAKRRTVVHLDSLWDVIGDGLMQREPVEVVATPKKENDYTLTFRMFSLDFWGPPKMLVTVPEAWYCELRDDVTVTVKGGTFTGPGGKANKWDKPILFDEINPRDPYGPNRMIELCRDGKVVAKITGDMVFRAPRRKG